MLTLGDKAYLLPDGFGKKGIGNTAINEEPYPLFTLWPAHQTLNVGYAHLNLYCRGFGVTNAPPFCSLALK
jgi:hypothetical protein